jgi:hypothetical protein
MHTAAKVLLILGTIATVLGVIGFALGADKIDDLEESANQFELKDVTEGTIMIDDEDGQGELGLTFWVKGVYEDLDGNGYWDACNNTKVEVIENPEIIESNWSTGASELDGKFYNEVVANYSGSDESDCAVNDNNMDLSKNGDGLVKIGRACFGCTDGNFSFTSNQSVWVTYDDKILADVFEDGVAVLLGMGGGFLGICCGVLLLIIGGILALTLNDNKQQVMYAPPANNVMMANDGLVQPTTYTNPDHMPAPMTTHMSAPTFEEPPKGGL